MCTADFVVRVDKMLQIGSMLFQNCSSFFGTQGTVFVVHVLTALLRLSCQMMTCMMSAHLASGEGIASGNWVAKCLPH